MLKNSPCPLQLTPFLFVLKLLFRNDQVAGESSSVLLLAVQFYLQLLVFLLLHGVNESNRELHTHSYKLS